MACEPIALAANGRERCCIRRGACKVKVDAKQIYVLLQLVVRLLPYWISPQPLLKRESSMAYELNASNLLNPMMVWSDLGLRALDMTVSSSQNITESVDRLTRASAEPIEDLASSSAVSRQSDFAIPSAVALSADLQRSTFDLMMQGWMQWVSTIGTFASIAAGLGQTRSPKRQHDPLEAMRKSLLPFMGTGTTDTPARSASSSRQQVSRRDAHAKIEHAFASGEPKRRRGTGRAKSKSRRSRSS